MSLLTGAVEWQAALRQFSQHDAYHTWDYHVLEGAKDPSQPFLFVHETAAGAIALPFLVRAVSEDLADVTSVYGYAGPLVAGSIGGAEDFRASLRAELEELRVVTVFNRLHPLMNQDALLGGCGDVVAAGTTVSIDLTLSDEEQFSRYRPNLRREVRALRDSSVECVESADNEDIESFVQLYNDTMRRRGAADAYLVSTEYIGQLLAAQDFSTHLFKCELDGAMICAGLFMRCGSIVQYHLSGTDAGYYELAPTKLLLDTVRLWASDQGASVFHLGGGVGGAEDSLYRFKKGFSKRTHPFSTWRWVVDESRYAELCEARDREHGPVANSDFFPYYRAPQCTA